MNDTNEFVAAAAAHSLARLDVTNAAPSLFAKLKTRLQSTNTFPEELERQSSAVMRDVRSDFNRGPAYQLLDPDHLEMRIGIRVPARAKQMASMRLPPRPFNMPTHDYTLADALIEALGDLGYTPATDELFNLWGTDYEAEAIRALSKLAPERLTGELLATAKDKQIDGYVRERAMVTLGIISATNHVRDLIPLLDDTTPIVYERTLPGPEWRVCDRAAETIAILLGWKNGRLPIYIRPEQREEMMNRVRDWAKQSQ